MSRDKAEQLRSEKRGMEPVWLGDAVAAPKRKRTSEKKRKARRADFEASQKNRKPLQLQDDFYDLIAGYASGDLNPPRTLDRARRHPAYKDIFRAVDKFAKPGQAGLKTDDGKLRYDLVDDAAMDEQVAVKTFGAVAYEPDNWRVVEDAFERYVAAARRHLSDRKKGQRFDKETGLLELAHVACCVHFLLGLEIMWDPSLIASLPERLAKAMEVAREKRALRLAKESGKVAENSGRKKVEKKTR